MDWENEKCVMVLDGDLPPGLLANMAAILGITLGKERPEVVGPPARDKSGITHPGIIEFPVPILRGSRETIRALREKLREPAFQALTAVDFTDLAQGCRTYREFLGKMGETREEALAYLGLAVCGGKRQVNQLTGNLPLLR